MQWQERDREVGDGFMKDWRIEDEHYQEQILQRVSRSFALASADYNWGQSWGRR